MRPHRCTTTLRHSPANHFAREQDNCGTGIKHHCVIQSFRLLSTRRIFRAVFYRLDPTRRRRGRSKARRTFWVVRNSNDILPFLHSHPKETGQAQEDTPAQQRSQAVETGHKIGGKMLLRAAQGRQQFARPRRLHRFWPGRPLRPARDSARAPQRGPASVGQNQGATPASSAAAARKAQDEVAAAAARQTADAEDTAKMEIKNTLRVVRAAEQAGRPDALPSGIHRLGRVRRRACHGGTFPVIDPIASPNTNQIATHTVCPLSLPNIREQISTIVGRESKIKNFSMRKKSYLLPLLEHADRAAAHHKSYLLPLLEHPDRPAVPSWNTPIVPLRRTTPTFFPSWNTPIVPLRTT